MLSVGGPWGLGAVWCLLAMVAAAVAGRRCVELSQYQNQPTRAHVHTVNWQPLSKTKERLQSRVLPVSQEYQRRVSGRGGRLGMQPGEVRHWAMPRVHRCPAPMALRAT